MKWLDCSVIKQALAVNGLKTITRQQLVWIEFEKETEATDSIDM